MCKIIFEDNENQNEYYNIPEGVYNAMHSLMECFCETKKEIKVKKHETGNSDKT